MVVDLIRLRQRFASIYTCPSRPHTGQHVYHLLKLDVLRAHGILQISITMFSIIPLYVGCPLFRRSGSAVKAGGFHTTLKARRFNLRAGRNWVVS